ncbi:MAG: hypothetical protein ACOVKC_08815 [Brevundimonas sp.]
MQTGMRGFQRQASGLLAPARSLNGFVRQSMTPTKKVTSLLGFGPASRGPRFSGSEGRWLVTNNSAVDGAIPNAFAYLTKAILPSTGTWYWEVSLIGSAGWLLHGVAWNIVNPGGYSGYFSTNAGFYSSANASWAQAPGTNGDFSLAPAVAAGDAMGVFYNSNTGALDFSLNGSLMGAPPITTLPAVPMYPIFSIQGTNITAIDIRYGLNNPRYPQPTLRQYGS